MSDDDNQPLVREAAGGVRRGNNNVDDDAGGNVFTVSQLAEAETQSMARTMASMRTERERIEREEESVEEQADLVMTIMKPVSVTMIVVIALVKSITVPSLGLSPGQVLLYQEQSSPDDNSQQLTGALITGAIALVGVVVATTAFFCLYKYRCMKVQVVCCVFVRARACTYICVCV